MIELAILFFMSSLAIGAFLQSDAGERIKEGFKTRKEDLEINWKEFYKHNK